VDEQSPKRNENKSYIIVKKTVRIEIADLWENESTLKKCTQLSCKTRLSFKNQLSCVLQGHGFPWVSVPLHTRAKSRDHEIVRAQKEVIKGPPNTPPKS
jgi:hypothetical protein